MKRSEAGLLVVVFLTATSIVTGNVITRDVILYASNISAGSGWVNIHNAAGDNDNYATNNGNTTTYLTAAMENISLPSCATVTQVKVNASCRYNDGTWGKIEIRVDPHNIIQTSPRFQTVNYEFGLRMGDNGIITHFEPDGWSQSEINALVLKIRRKHNVTDFRVRHLRVKVTYTMPDSDGDGYADCEDNCPYHYNVQQNDEDGDGMGNSCDPDDDNDGVPDRQDNCRLDYNPRQNDHDGDGSGNVCDGDDDNDGIPDVEDEYPFDRDNDGVNDNYDNCPDDPNEPQHDHDNDGMGNICDPDDDNDGIPDSSDQYPYDYDNDGRGDRHDNCPQVYNPGQEDRDGDGLGDACDDPIVWYVDDNILNNNDGLSWASAFRNLQDAFAIAQSGDTIRMAGGTYKPTSLTDPDDPRTATFMLVNGVTIQGGYAGASNPSNPNENNPDVYRTILSGDQDGQKQMKKGSDEYLVKFATSVTAGDGWTEIEHAEGNNDDYANNLGTETYLTAEMGDISLPENAIIRSVAVDVSCRFDNNTTGKVEMRVMQPYGVDLTSPAFTTTDYAFGFRMGGAADITSLQPDGWTVEEVNALRLRVKRKSLNNNDTRFRVRKLRLKVYYGFSEGDAYHVVTVPSGYGDDFFLRDLEITSGEATGPFSSQQYGGGIYSQGAHLALQNCILRSNKAIKGGGISVIDGSVSALNCRIESNSCNNGTSESYKGGGIYLDNSAGLLDQCSIQGNSSFVGGGVYAESTNLTMEQGALSNNMATRNGGGLYWVTVSSDGGSLALSGPSFNGNHATVAGGGGCILVDSDDQSQGSDRITIAHSTFINNEASHGGGLRYESNNETIIPYLEDCIFTGNSAGNDGCAVSVMGIGRISFTQCLFSGNCHSSLIYDQMMGCIFNEDCSLTQDVGTPAALALDYSDVSMELRDDLTVTEGPLYLEHSLVHGDGSLLLGDSATLKIGNRSGTKETMTTQFQTDVLGLGDIQIGVGAIMQVTDGAIVDLSGGEGGAGCGMCVEPDDDRWGEVIIDGSLLVKNGTIRNTKLIVTLGDFEGSEVVNNDIHMPEISKGHGAQFFMGSSSLIACNRVVAYGDRYLDFDPDPNNSNQLVCDNLFYVEIHEGIEGGEGTLLELRAFDYDCSENCTSGLHHLTSSPGYNDTWALEELEIFTRAKVNLTNRHGFDFNEDSEDVLYVKKIILHPEAVLNTGLQRIYYQELEFLDDQGNPTSSNGSVIKDVPLLGFSLHTIYLEDDTEFENRISRRTTDPNDEQPCKCGIVPCVEDYDEPAFCHKGSIRRIDISSNGPSFTGLMEMCTYDSEIGTNGSASSVAAKGTFERAGEEDVTIFFDYLWQEGTPEESKLLVYISNYSRVSQCFGPNSFDDCHIKIAELDFPVEGRPGSVGSNQFATFYTTIPTGLLNFTKGTYVELELQGNTSRIWIDNWDPMIDCAGTTCGDVTGTEDFNEIDCQYVFSHIGSIAGEGMHCVDNRLTGYDHQIDEYDILTWNAMLEIPGVLDHLCRNWEVIPVRDHQKANSPKHESFADSIILSGLKRDHINALLRLPVEIATCAGGDILYSCDDILAPLCGEEYSCDFGSGRLVSDSRGELYQIHGVNGVIQSRTGKNVVPPRVLSLADIGEVCVGLIPGSDQGCPIIDAAIDPHDPNTFYVVPVTVLPSTGNCPYRAAAKLQLDPLQPGEYSVEAILGNDPEIPPTSVQGYGDYCFYAESGQAMQQKPREIEVDDHGHVFVLYADGLLNNMNNWIIVYQGSSQSTRIHQLVHLDQPESGGPIPIPSSMLIDNTTDRIFLTSSRIAEPDIDSNIYSASIEYSGEDSALSELGMFGIYATVIFPVPAPIEQFPQFTSAMSNIVSLASDNSGGIVALGYSAPYYADESFTETTPSSLYSTPGLAYIPYGTPHGSLVPASQLVSNSTGVPIALPLSLVCTPKTGAGDMDQDGDVDLADYAAFQRCINSSETDCLDAFDFHKDSVIDDQDFLGFEPMITGIRHD